MEEQTQEMPAEIQEQGKSETPGVPEQKPKWWLWVAGALAVIVLGAGAYYWFFIK